MISYGVLAAFGIFIVVEAVLRNLSNPVTFNAICVWAALSGTPVTLWYYVRHRNSLPDLLSFRRVLLVMTFTSMAAWAYFRWVLHEDVSDASVLFLCLFISNTFVSNRVRSLEESNAAR